MAKQHALLSASSSKMWLECTPSAVLNADKPDKETPYSKEGTEAHALAEKKLISWIKNNRKSRFKAPDGEMNEYTDDYRDYIIEVFNSEKAKTPDAQLLIEQRLDFSRWVPDGFGTGDAVIIGDDTCHVIDLKYGQGVLVKAEGNTQARLYAAGALDTYGLLYDFDKITVHIYQPRMNNISTCTYTVAELEEWLEKEVVPKAQLAIKGEGSQKAGDWCHFCKINGNCSAQMLHALTDLIQSGFNTDCKELTQEQIEMALPLLPGISKWIKSLEEYALDQALQGTRYKGFKLVEGRSVRKVTDEAGLIEALHKLDYKDGLIMTKPKLETISNLEKAIGKKMFAGISMPYIDKPKGKPTLVPISDKRPEYRDEEKEMNEFADEFKKEGD